MRESLLPYCSRKGRGGERTRHLEFIELPPTGVEEKRRKRNGGFHFISAEGEKRRKRKKEGEKKSPLPDISEKRGAAPMRAVSRSSSKK